jgi:hypothetical protein
MIEYIKETLEIAQQNEYFAYCLAVLLGISIGALIIRKMESRRKPKKHSKKKKNLFSEYIQSLALAAAASCFATTIGYAATLIDDNYITFLFILIILFLVGISLTIFGVVAYHLYKK